MIIPSPIVISPSSSTLPLSETNVKLSPLSIASLAVAAVILSLLFPKDCVLFRPTQHKEGCIRFRRLFFLACHKHIVAYIYLRRSYNILIVVYLVTGNRNIVYTEKDRKRKSYCDGNYNYNTQDKSNQLFILRFSF